MQSIYYIIISIIAVTALSTLGTKSIKKYANAYYIVAAIIATVTTIFEILRLTSNAKLVGILGGLEKASMKGYIALAFFILVMFAGAMNVKWEFTRKLLTIRGELAILGTILMMPHGVMYLVRFIVRLFSGKTPTAVNIIYLVLGLLSFGIMIPLGITSIKSIRRKMDYYKWKSIQRWAYLFFAAAYIHIAIIILASDNIDWLKFSLYTIIFVGYIALKTTKVNDMERVKRRAK